MPQNNPNLVTLAKTRLKKGIIHEPRGYYDIIKLDNLADAGLITNGHPDIFRNGEEYPVIITHATFSTGYYNYSVGGVEDGAPDDPADISVVGVNMRFHDQFYMNPVHIPVSLWGNKVVSSVDTISHAGSAWSLDAGRYIDRYDGGCFVLSARDTLDIELSLLSRMPNVAVTTLSMGVTFAGFGLVTERPYTLSSRASFTARNQVVGLDTDDFRNDGSEPILITDMTVVDQTVYNADADEQSTFGDIRRAGVNVRQIGNGTNQYWFRGPLALPPINQCPAALLGMTSGRAVVHEFPVPITWEPGNGISVSAQGLTTEPPNTYVNIGLFGYIMIA